MNIKIFIRILHELVSETPIGPSNESAVTWWCGDMISSSQRKGTCISLSFFGINGAKFKTAPLIIIVHIIFHLLKNSITDGSSDSGLNRVTLQTQGLKSCFSNNSNMIELDWAFTMLESPIECTPDSFRRFSSEPEHVNTNSRFQFFRLIRP